MQGNYAVAQTVSGIVVDAKSGSPLPFVNVYYEGKGVGAATDENGNFSVPYRKGWNQAGEDGSSFQKDYAVAAHPAVAVAVNRFYLKVIAQQKVERLVAAHRQCKIFTVDSKFNFHLQSPFRSKLSVCRKERREVLLLLPGHTG